MRSAKRSKGKRYSEQRWIDTDPETGVMSINVYCGPLNAHDYIEGQMKVTFEQTIRAEVELPGPMFRQDLEAWANSTNIPPQPVDLRYLIEHGVARCTTTNWRAVDSDTPLVERNKRGRPRKLPPDVRAAALKAEQDKVRAVAKRSKRATKRGRRRATK